MFGISFSDFYLLIATGQPYEESRGVELINWSKKRKCSTTHVAKFPLQLAYATGGSPSNFPMVCGGMYPNGTHSPHCWTLHENDWFQAPFQMIVPVTCTAGLVINETLIISGGYNLKGTADNRTQIVATNQIQLGPKLKLGVHAHCMVEYNSSIWIIGGVGVTEVQIYHLNMTFIRQGPRLTKSRNNHGCASFQRKGKEAIIVVGGDGVGAKAEYLDSSTNKWIEGICCYLY